MVDVCLIWRGECCWGHGEGKGLVGINGGFD